MLFFTVKKLAWYILSRKRKLNDELESLRKSAFFLKMVFKILFI